MMSTCIFFIKYLKELFMDRIEVKTVVITDASSGFSRVLPMDFAKLGWKVTVSDINQDK
jgi:NADP-dependent 3-hydroxy acid dehydrogenase YdfG